MDKSWMKGEETPMERKGFTMKIKPGVLEEYKRRHDAIWPEMSEVLTKAGLKNYSIWILDDETLLGYYETEDDEYAVKVQEESEVVKRWNVYMEDMIATRTLPDGSKEPIKDFVDCVFLHT